MDFVHPVHTVIPGVQGRILAVLAETSGELNLRTIASIANVSEAQVSRVLPGLVAVGLVERREAPPSALFRLVREHIAAGPILALSRTRDRMIQEMRRIAESLSVPPASVIIFGSFARGQADAESDIDTLLVRPSGVSESDEAWSATVQQWIDRVSDVSGNRVEVLEVDEDEVPARLDGGRSVWREIERDGLIIHGATLDSYRSVVRG
ncbi:MAG TPA: nucleotidyltransferase domain-containing protein [Acidimicrobiia bacterium]|nr:nucleotidyltransferase domain-containing protein [Acidimicrobiia bacterium]